jgi:aldehyde dehydrogenase (NAD+)
MGPLASADQYEKVTEYIDLGKESDARLVTGGDSPENPQTADGWFVEPTIFADVDNDSRLAQEEIFGPVASVIEFTDYEDAISTANDIQYGLAAGVATSDLSVAHNAAADIEAGTVWVNQYGRLVPGTPFGGFKRSGIGRECARETLGQYQQTKTVNIALDEPEL